MKSLTPIIFLLLTVSQGQAAESAIENEWFREDLSNDKRNELVERAKAETFQKIAPTILKVLVDYVPRYRCGSNGPSGDTPWNDERLRFPRTRTYVMAGAVWQHHLNQRNNLRIAKGVLSLLRMTKRPEERNILIIAIWKYQWCPDSEQALIDVCRAAKESLDNRLLAARVLLDRCNINTYMPIAIETILAKEKGLPRCHAFHSTINQGNRLFTLNDKNRHLVLATGFGILDELPDEDLKVGYFVARCLGFILQTKNEFAPDQPPTRYQGKNGLKGEFFIDTVKNARAWYSKHKSEVRSN